MLGWKLLYRQHYPSSIKIRRTSEWTRGKLYKKRLPVELVYHEEYAKIANAFYREKQVQGWSRKKKLALIEGRLEELPKLAKKIFREG